jgi:hypothetical protein
MTRDGDYERHSCIKCGRTYFGTSDDDGFCSDACRASWGNVLKHMFSFVIFRNVKVRF